jgi:hypothetical protein
MKEQIVSYVMHPAAMWFHNKQHGICVMDECGNIDGGTCWLNLLISC